MSLPHSSSQLRLQACLPPAPLPTRTDPRTVPLSEALCLEHLPAQPSRAHGRLVNPPAAEVRLVLLGAHPFPALVLPPAQRSITADSPLMGSPLRLSSVSPDPGCGSGKPFFRKGSQCTCTSTHTHVHVVLTGMTGLKMSSAPGSKETGSHTVGKDRSRREGSVAQEGQTSVP